MPIYKANGKKDGLQKYNVRVNYISGDGKAKQLTRTAYGLEAAKDMERRLMSDIKDKGENPARKMTVQQLFDEYISAKRYEVRESTVDKHKRNFALYLSPLANVRIDRLSPARIHEWKQTLNEKGLALKTKSHAYSLVRSILNHAVRMEYLVKSPLVNVGNFKDSANGKQEMHIYTAQEFTRFINTAKKLAEKSEIVK